MLVCAVSRRTDWSFIMRSRERSRAALASSKVSPKDAILRRTLPFLIGCAFSGWRARLPSGLPSSTSDLAELASSPASDRGVLERGVARHRHCQGHFQPPPPRSLPSKRSVEPGAKRAWGWGVWPAIVSRRCSLAGMPVRDSSSTLTSSIVSNGSTDKTIVSSVLIKIWRVAEDDGRRTLRRGGRR